MMLLEAPSRPERRKNKASRVFGPPYRYFDRRALRAPVPGWRLRLHRSALVRAIIGEVQPVKRVIDLAGALTLCVLLAPVFFLIAAAITLQDGGPVLYWQTRVGR